MNQATNAALFRLIDVCSANSFAVGEAILIGEKDRAAVHVASFGADVTGLESFVNHVHLSDLWHDELHRPSLTELRAIAVVVMNCWFCSLMPLLRNRAIYVFAGGDRDDFWIRCHVDRGRSNAWADVTDTGFLRSNGVAVWRCEIGGIAEIVEWS